MSYELSESVKFQIIDILNKNIKLYEAENKEPANVGLTSAKTSSKDEDEEDSFEEKNKKSSDNTDGAQGGHGAPSPEKGKPSMSMKDILLGTQSKSVPGISDKSDPTAAILGLGLGAGILGAFGPKIFNKVTGGAGGKVISALGDKIGKDISTLSGVPGALAQIADIVPHQVATRWEGSGTHGWFRPMVPKPQKGY